MRRGGGGGGSEVRSEPLAMTTAQNTSLEPDIAWVFDITVANSLGAGLLATGTVD